MTAQATQTSGLAGGCLCGAVRYVAHGEPFHQTVCHCTICRRASGAPMVAWFTVKADALALSGDAPVTRRSSPKGVRTFCGKCGTPLTFRLDGLDEVDVTTASLDDPEAVPPADHTYAATQLGWLRLDDGLPRHDRAR